MRANFQGYSIAQAIEELYRREINFSISCFWDGGIDVRLGDNINGWKAHINLEPSEMKLAGDWMLEKAVTYWPEEWDGE